MLPCGGEDLSVYQVRRARRGGNSAARPFWVLGVALTFGRCFLGGWLPGGRQARQGWDYLRFLFGNQRLSVCCDVSGNRHLTADCRFLCGQKAAEKPAPSSEAGGTAQGACGPLKKPRGKKWVAPRIASCNLMEHGLWSALRASQDTRSPGLPYLCAGPLPQASAWGQTPSPSRFPFYCPKARL